MGGEEEKGEEGEEEEKGEEGEEGKRRRRVDEEKGGRRGGKRGGGRGEGGEGKEEKGKEEERRRRKGGGWKRLSETPSRVAALTHLAHTIVFGGCVDGYEDKVCLYDGCVNIGRKEEIAPSAFLNYLKQTRLKNNQLQTFETPHISHFIMEYKHHRTDYYN